MIQYIIKDGHGKPLQSRASFPSFAKVAREMLDIDAQLPLSVWAHSTVLGSANYDGSRTRRLSAAIVAARKVQS